MALPAAEGPPLDGCLPAPDGPTTDTPRPLTPGPRGPRFIADPSLHRVARHLRMLGASCLCSAAYSQDPTILLDLAREEDLIILTSSLELLDMITEENTTKALQPVSSGRVFQCHKYFFLKSKSFTDRLKHVAFHFGLEQAVRHKEEYRPRCPQCNEWLTVATVDEIKGKLDPSIVAFHREFWACSACGTVSYALRDTIIQALRRVEPDGNVVLAPSPAPPHCSFVLPRAPRCHVLRFLPLKDVVSFMQCSKSTAQTGQDNMFWKWKFEEQLHLLSFTQAMASLRSRKVDAPFGRVPYRNPADPSPLDPPLFWLQTYRDLFAAKSRLKAPSRYKSISSTPSGTPPSGAHDRFRQGSSRAQLTSP